VSVRCLFVVIAVLGSTACGRKEQVVETSTKPAFQPSKPGRIVIPADSPKLHQIRVEPVRTAEVPTNEIDAPGKIEANPNRVSHVTLPVVGRVSAVLVHIGDFVKQGQPVLSLESPDVDAASSAYLQADAALTQAKATLIKSQADADRAHDLFEHNALAQKEVLNADNALAQSKSAVEQAEAAKKQAARKLELFGLKPGEFGQKVVVHAPISGKVLEMTITAGEFRNDMNASVITISDLSSVWVSSDVPESSIRFIRLNERLEIQLAAYPGETFTGRVARISDVVDPQTRSIKVQAEMDNSRGRFRPEMFGRIRAVEGTSQRPVVPSGAVVQADSQNSVYVERSPGVFDMVPVTLGPRVRGNVAVVSGLAPGDRVVVDGVMLLKGL
jgi:cobalt-zinc-cadmium efflux system membrane fusion protein